MRALDLKLGWSSTITTVLAIAPLILVSPRRGAHTANRTLPLPPMEDIASPDTLVCSA